MRHNREIILHYYEESILGKSKFTIKGPEILGEEFVGENAQNEKIRFVAKRKEEDALYLTRYIITDILGWTPQEAMVSLTDDVVKQVKLDEVLAYISFPPDLNKKKDYDYLVHLAFPDETTFDVTDRVLQMYQRVKRGEIARFPKRFFEGDNPVEKLTILLKDYVSQNLPAGQISDLYDAFGVTAKGNALMHDAQLFYAYKEIYDTPLDYLHVSLGENNDSFLYEFYKHAAVVNEIERELLKEKIQKLQSNDDTLKTEEETP